MMIRVLLIDDDDGFADLTARYISSQADIEVAVAASEEEVEDLLQFYDPQFVVSDFDLGPNQPDGVKLLSKMREGVTTVLWSGIDRAEEVCNLQAVGYRVPDYITTKDKIQNLLEILA